MKGQIDIHHGDSRDVLKTLADNSIDSVVTDPPYALVSISKRFGADGAASAKEGATGAYARASAGFMGQKWDTGETAFSVEFWAEIMRVLKPGGHVVAASGTRTYHRLACAIEDAGFEIRDMVSWLYGSGFPKSHDVSKGIDKAAGAAPIKTDKTKRAGIAQKSRGGGEFVGGTAIESEKIVAVTAAATPEAEEWEGWGTALKPACEPWVLARKPLERGLTVAANALKWGTGALNIDGCRVGTDETITATRNVSLGSSASGVYGAGIVPGVYEQKAGGRWPANVVHDGSDEVVNYLGEPSRFFYSAKADTHDRLGSGHPTVKPVDLMRWLCRLITPPGGTVLDPFAGSGTMGQAALWEGFSAILIEREDKFHADIVRRIAWARGEGRHTATEKERKPSSHSETNAMVGAMFGNVVHDD